MSALSVEVPFPVFYDRAGEPLENGYVWIGQANLNPQTNPIQVYFDRDLTQPAAQPLRTLAGYISNAGTPAQIYVDAVNFSILVQDKNGTMVYNFPDGTGIAPLPNDACGLAYTPNFSGAVTRPTCEKLEESISVKDFGAVGDGVTDETNPFQLAINAVLAAGGRRIYIPAGTYYFDGPSPSLDPGAGGIVFYGDGRDATTLKWAGSTTGVYIKDVNDPSSKALFKNIINTPKNSLLFEKIKFQGLWVNGLNGGGASMWLDYYDDITIRDCSFIDCANICIDLHFLQSFHCEDNMWIDNARDCIRVRDTPNCVVTGNYILRNGDDAIALHISDDSIGTWPIRSQMVVTGNNIINAGTIKCLGGRRIVIADNTLRFPNLVGIQVTSSSAFPEGNTNIFDVTVCNNIISDLLSVTTPIPQTTATAIAVHGQTPRGSASTNNTIPGQYDSTTSAFVFPWNVADVDTSNLANPATATTGINISGNTIRRTAKTVSAFSDYGFGTRLFGGVEYNPAITDESLRQTAGVRIDFPGFKSAIISNNIIENFLNGISFASATSNFDYIDVLVESNVISNCINRGVLVNSSNFSVGITIRNNVLNLDPYRQNLNSNVNGTYIAQGLPRGIDLANNRGAVVTGNNFYNTCEAIQSNVQTSLIISENYLNCGAITAVGFDAAHKGIGVILSPALGYRINEIDADPTSATYLNVVHTQYDGAGAQPSTGSWVRGAFVKNNAPTIDANSMSLVGWLRISTGSGNVAGTDWVAVRTSNVSPAV